MNRLQKRLCIALETHLATGRPAQIPDWGRIVWNAFAALSAARQWHSYGPQPISYPEIAAWAQLHRTPLGSAHIDTIRALDAVWLANARKEKPKPKGPGFTVEMFDAMVG